jgi:hypothetical protein
MQTYPGVAARRDTLIEMPRKAFVYKVTLA